MSIPSFRERYGPWALVAGASLGLGAAYSHALARRGLNVVMVAECDEPLQGVAAAVAATHGVQTMPLVSDLSEPQALDALIDATVPLDLGLLVCNAAFAPVGAFLDLPLAAKQKMVDVNCHAPLRLCDHFAARFVDRGRGGIILMSSLSAFQGQAMVATYAATKAFNLVLAESLWAELSPRGVDVLAVCPGTTRTPGFESSQPRMSGAMRAQVMTPEAVVDEALAGLGKRQVVIPGRGNRLAAFVLQRLLPRSLTVRLMSRVTRGMYASPSSR